MDSFYKVFLVVEMCEGCNLQVPSGTPVHLYNFTTSTRVVGILCHPLPPIKYFKLIMCGKVFKWYPMQHSFQGEFSKNPTPGKLFEAFRHH